MDARTTLRSARSSVSETRPPQDVGDWAAESRSGRSPYLSGRIGEHASTRGRDTRPGAAKSHLEVELIAVSVNVERCPTRVAILLARHDKCVFFRKRVPFAVRTVSLRLPNVHAQRPAKPVR